MALAHEGGVIEVACNLLDPAVSPPAVSARRCPQPAGAP
jgi:hypothetical protein